MVETGVQARRLMVEGLALAGPGQAFDETIEAGAIVGLAGLDGHGQEHFIESLAGLRAPARGTVRLEEGGRTTAIRSFSEAARAGIVYLPQDRRKTGIFPNLSVLDNFAMASLARDRRGPLLDLGRRRRRYEALRDRLSIVADEPRQSITRLSGGNQQKVLLARLLARDPGVLLLNDPTRGVDIATRRVLYAVFAELAARGIILVVLSSEIEEVVALCDRVLVFREQELSARFGRAEATSERIIAAMFGRAA